MLPEINERHKHVVFDPHRFVPIIGKAPRAKNWPNRTFDYKTDFDSKSHTGIGIKTGNGLLAIDFDDCWEEFSSYAFGGVQISSPRANSIKLAFLIADKPEPIDFVENASICSIRMLCIRFYCNGCKMMKPLLVSQRHYL